MMIQDRTRDTWTFPMMIIMAGNSSTEAFLRFGSAVLHTLRIAAFPPTPASVVAAAEREPRLAQQIIDEWCEKNKDPGAAAFMIVKYKDDIEEHLTVNEASGSWFQRTMPLASPIAGPEIVFKLRNIRDESRVIHIIAGLGAI